MSDYFFHILIQACITSTLAVSLNLLAGYGGLVSLGQLSFFAIGAYSAALVAPASSIGYALALPVAVAVAALGAIAQSSMTANLRDDEFAIATFAMHSVFWMLLMNWVDLTRGPMGIPGVPPFQAFGYSFEGPAAFLPIAVTLLTLSLFIIWQLSRHPFGMALRMLRDAEDLAAGFGRDVKSLRRSVMVLAAVIAACAGVGYASYVEYINPATFSPMESTLLLAIVIVGGLGTFWGPVIGASILTFVPEALRFVGFPTAQAANIRQIVLGLLLIAIVLRTRIVKHQSLFQKGGELP